MDDTPITDFIDRWKPSGGAERANYQMFLAELCDVLEVPHPDPTVEVEPDNRYVFEKNVVFDNGDGTTSTRRIDLYRRGCFVCETKQGVENTPTYNVGSITGCGSEGTINRDACKGCLVAKGSISFLSGNSYWAGDCR